MALSPQEQARLDELNKRLGDAETEFQANAPKGVADTGHGLTPEEQARLDHLNAMLDPHDSGAARFAQGVGQVFNAVPGTARAAIYNTQAAVRGSERYDHQPQTLQQAGKDLLTGIQGKYPGSSELYGVGPAAGFAMDVAQDVPGYSLLSKGAGMIGGRVVAPIARAATNLFRSDNAAAQALKSSLEPQSMLGGLSSKIAKYFESNPNGTWNADGDAATALGKKVYKSAGAPLDAAVDGTPNLLPTDVLWDKNKLITRNGVEGTMQGLNDAASAQNTEIFSKASRGMQKGAIDGLDMPRTDALLKKFNSLPIEQRTAQTFQILRDQYAAMPPASLNRALELKASARNAAREAMVDGGAGASATDKLHRASMLDLDEKITNAISKMNDPMAQKAAEVARRNNQIQGSMIEALPAAKGMQRPLVTPEDLMTAGAGWALGLPGAAKLAIGIKKGAQAAFGPGVKSGIGLGLKLTGKVPGASAGLLSTGVSDLTSPWTLLDKDKRK